jgi:AcrR family transcriptional regulator
MARIAGRTREDTRRAALLAARTVFARRGFGGTSLQEVADVAGVTPAALCHHFGHKRGLYDAVVDELYERLLGAREVVDPDKPLRDVVAAVYEHCLAERDAIRVLLRDVLDRGGLDERTRTRHAAPLLEAVAAELGRRRGVPALRARAALVALSHLTARFVTNRDEDNAALLGVKGVRATRAAVVDVLGEVAEQLLSPPRGARTAKTKKRSR